MTDIGLLEHITRPLPYGGMILILNRGEVIGPESEAMVQALHSRSVGGIKKHLETLKKKGPENFMSTYYVGYGDKSIGDCGTTTIFIEGVSMLVAKAIQDTQLYNGQESSTRYIDFSSQPFIDPVGTDASRKILEGWRAFYLAKQESVRLHLKNLYPPNEGEEEAIYEKAIKARAFDIMRGFLPSGASTNLSWHVNLRQCADRLLLLRYHPLEEVREVASAIEDAAKEAFPNSFNQKRYEATEKYNEFWMSDFYYFEQPSCNYQDILCHNNVDNGRLWTFRRILSRRPPKTELPKFIAELGTLQFEFMLDFGSFRDIERHRAVAQRMPLVTDGHGFGTWYLESLPKDVREEAEKLLSAQKTATDALRAKKTWRQYYVPVGYELPNQLTGDLSAIVYLVELRATRFVHPTLQRIASEMGEVLMREFGRSGLVLHLDKEPGRFDVRRGKQDIIERS